MDLTYYERLPDGMNATEVAREFERLLSEADQPGVLCVSVAEALWQLADRQWHTYELLRPGLRARVEMWIQQHWLADLKFIEWIGGSAGMLGLAGVIPLLERTARECGDVGLRQEIEETLSEIKPHIDDPYWSMRKE